MADEYFLGINRPVLIRCDEFAVDYGARNPVEVCGALEGLHNRSGERRTVHLPGVPALDILRSQGAVRTLDPGCGHGHFHFPSGRKAPWLKCELHRGPGAVEGVVRVSLSSSSGGAP